MPTTNTEADAILHGQLAKHALSIVQKLRTVVNQGFKPTPGFLFWPKQALQDKQGRVIDSVVAMEVQDDDELRKHIPIVAKKYQAQGVLAIRVGEPGLQFILASPAKCESWRLSWSRHGDIRVLSEPVHEEHDTSWMGISWWG